MLNCPFCNADYGDTGLRDGRCRNCGGVIAWEEDDPVDPALMQQVQAAAEARQTPVESKAPPAGTPPLEAASSDPSGSPNDGGRESNQDTHDANAASAMSSDTAVDPPSNAPTASDLVKVTSVWQEASRTASSPLVTIEADEPPPRSGAPLVIQRRSLVHQGEASAEHADYELLDVIGEGGVGVVYSARQASIDREVAVKMLRTEKDSEQQTDAFLSEAVVTGDLDHPNIVPIHDLGRSDAGAVFYAMKRVQGTPWDQVIGTNSLTENLEILMKVADAVAFAHARGIVHRDLKPENVMLGDFGEVLVMDWGIAIATEAFIKIDRCNTSQAMGGTPAYMAPEMVLGPFSQIGTHSDIYLLGAILYEVITGYPPHNAPDVMACLMVAARNDIKPTDQRHELVDIALQAMSTEFAARPASVLEFQRQIRTYQSHSESILLSTRAAEDLEQGRESGEYEPFSRAVFAYEEALALWDGNQTARDGLVVARKEYAGRALQQSDFELGLSLLDADVPEFASLRKQLETGQRERDARLARVNNGKRLVAALVLILFVGGTIMLVKINQARREAEVDRRKAEVATDNANTALGKLTVAMAQEQEAVKKQKEANKAALAAKANAEAERDRADDEKRRAERLREIAEEESYFAEVGLASEKVATNAFADARAILTRQRESLRARMRHWEWGRMEYLCYGDSTAASSGLNSNGQGTDNQDALNRHTATQVGFPIEAVAVSPDGRYVFIGGTDGQLQYRELRGDGPLQSWNHGGQVTALSISPDGRWGASAGSDETGGVVKIWDLQGETMGAPKVVLGPHGAVVLGVSFAPPSAGDTLLTASDNKTMKLWNSQTGAELQTFAGHSEQIWSARFSPDGTRIVSASDDGSARVWSTASGEEVQRFVGHKGPVYDAVYAPQGDRIASAGYDMRVLLWKANPGEAGTTALLEQVAKAVRGEAMDAPKFQAFDGHSGSVRSLNFSGDGDLLLSAGHDNTIRVWDARDTSSVDPTGPTNATDSADPAGGDGPTRVADILQRRARSSVEDTALLVTLRGHGGWVKSCVLLGDNQTVVSGSLDQALRSWNLLGYEERRIFNGPQRPILAAAMSPDQQFIVTGLDDGSSHIWDTATGAELGVLTEGHEYLTSTAAFFPDGDRLLTAGGDDTARIWSVSRGTQQQVLQGTGRRGMAALAPSGEMVLTGASDKRARIWEVASGQVLHELDPHEEIFQKQRARHPQLSESQVRKVLPDISALAFSPDNQVVLTGDSAGRCVLWDAASGQRQATLRGHSQSVSAAVFLAAPTAGTEDATHLVTAGTDGMVHQWNLHTNEYRRDLVLRHRYPVMSLAVSSDGKYCVTASAVSPNEGGLWFWELATATKLGEQAIPGRTVHTVTFDAASSGRESVALATTTDARGRRALLRWDIGQQKLQSHPNMRAQRGSLWMVNYTPDHQHLLTVGGKGARLWNEETGRQTTSFRPQSAITAVCVSPSSDRVVTASRDATAKIWARKTSWQATHNLSGVHTEEIRSVTFSADGSTIMTAGLDGLVAFWDAATGKPLAEHATFDNQGPVHAAVFSPDESQVLAAGEDADGSGIVKIWSRSGELLQTIEAHPQPVRAAAYSAGGDWIITGSDDTTARVWSARTGRQVAELEGHSAQVNEVSFSQDRLRALTCGADNTAKIWDTSFLASLTEADQTLVSPKEITTLKYHAQSVTSAEFTPDGRHILTASLDGTAALWLGTELDPAIRLSGRAIDYRGAAGKQIIDDHAIFSSPSAPDLNEATLTVTLDPADDPADHLMLAAASDHVSPVMVRGGEVLLDVDGEQKVMAHVVGGSDGMPLTITFTKAANRWGVEALLRCIAFEHRTAVESELMRTAHFRFALRNGRSGNFESETTTIYLLPE